MNRDTFSGYHPIVNFLYFGFTLAFAMIYTHPVCLALSLLCAVVYSVCLNGQKAVRFGLLYMLPMMLAAAALGPLFNHQGITVLAYFPGGNPLTLESVLYGAAAAVMLVAVVTWFSCVNAVITSDKLVYLFGRVVPSLSLILSMALRLVPRFKAQIKVISDAQKCVGRGVSDGNIPQKVRHGVRILSILVTWALENAIETADSMRSRGYGLPGRTAFSVHRFDRRDRAALVFLIACAVYIIVGSAAGGLYFRYFPAVNGLWDSPYTVSLFVVYFALCVFPIAVNGKEALVWKRIESKT